MKEYNLKHYAHLGDAVWELFIREFVINQVNTQSAMHKMSVKYVNANFQAAIVEKLIPDLEEKEKELLRRGAHLPLTAQKKNNQNIHRHATSLEVLVGYLYINNKRRLNEIFEIILKKAL